MTGSRPIGDEKRLHAYEQAITPEMWDRRFDGLAPLEQVELETIRLLTPREPGQQAPRRILDVGCGTGRLRALYPGETYVGVDRSHPFIRYCQDVRGGRGTHFVLADMDHLPFPFESFDVVLVIGTLESETSPAQRIAQLVRYLRPGGRLVVTLQNRRNIPGLLARALTRGYRQTFWSRRQLVNVLSTGYGPFEITTCFVLPPGVPRTLFRTVVRGRRARELILRLYLLLERLDRRWGLQLGYEWIVSVTRKAEPPSHPDVATSYPIQDAIPLPGQGPPEGEDNPPLAG